MEINLTTPALLFPAISLIMLAYTNRFLGLATVIRNLRDRFEGGRVGGQRATDLHQHVSNHPSPNRA
jgi:hypothetical protein